ncbi:MAG: transposase [Candidatus Zixiibacteriota bacterium]
MSLLEIVRSYSDDRECLKFLEDRRWPNGPVCPRCKAKKVYRLKAVDKFECSSCRYQFSATSGTIFHKSYIPLSKWFLAIYLMSATEKRIRTVELSRDLGLPYKTAWYLRMRIDRAMKGRELSMLESLWI